ncbi:hypothetical protein GOODEAATRI_005714, partial [Goodea atripinnis]
FRSPLHFYQSKSEESGALPASVQQSVLPQTQLISFCLTSHVCVSLQLTLSPAQQQLLLQQAQAHLLAAAVQQHSANQQNSTTGANISASAATPITQLPLSQPIQIAPPASPTRTTATTNNQSLPHSQTPPKRLDTPTMEEPSDLEELEQFAKTFKQRRIKLGFTQVLYLSFLFVGAVCAENLTSDQSLSSPSALGSPGMGIEGINRRRKKRTSIETNIRVASTASLVSSPAINTSATLTVNPVMPVTSTSVSSLAFTDTKAGVQTLVTQAPTSIATSLGTGQVMVAAPGLPAALQGAAQLTTSASFAAMAAAAGLNPGLMASSQFTPGLRALHTDTNLRVSSTALASSGSIPITSLDGSNLLFANTSATSTPNLVTTPLFFNPQNLSLLTSNPVSLVSAGTGGLQVTADGHHQATTAAMPVQASTITTASKAQ